MTKILIRVGDQVSLRWSLCMGGALPQGGASLCLGLSPHGPLVLSLNRLLVHPETARLRRRRRIELWFLMARGFTQGSGVEIEGVLRDDIELRKRLLKRGSGLFRFAGDHHAHAGEREMLLGK
jgi:hypothetical protein